MPSPSDAAVAGRERRIHAIIDFATDLLMKLPVSIDSNSDEALLADVNHHIQSINSLPRKPTGLSEKNTKSLKDYGRKLWNECVKEKRRRSNISGRETKSKLYVRARIFAYLVHAMACEGQLRADDKRHEEETILYVLNLALTVGRVCIQESDLDGALLVLRRIADHLERLKQMDGVSQDASRLTIRLEIEYFNIRIALAWKEDRLDVAEHMYNKADGLQRHFSPSSAENMSETLQSIGSDRFSKGDYSMALKWLQRAHQLINGQELEKLSANGLELRLTIYHSLIQALLATEVSENIQQANDLVAFVESEIGDKPIVLHWRLDILNKSPKEAFDTSAYASILRRMIRSIDFSDAIFGFLLYSIKKLRERSPKLAIGLLDELLFTRLLPLNNLEWTGKAVVRRVWVSTMETESLAAVDDLSNLFDRIVSKAGVVLRADVTVAAHSLIWKKLEAEYTDKQYNVAASWARAALHSLFANCDDGNKGKFGRRLILCAINCNDADTALSTFQAMPQVAQDDPLTRFLMFKVSLISWDRELGCQSIEHLSKSADQEQSQNILYACVREAQQVGDKLCTLAALKAVAEKSGSGASIQPHIPSVLRCTIRLIHLIETEEDEPQNGDIGLAPDICDIFEKAAECAQLDPLDIDGNKIFPVPELEWFRKNAYNMGVMRCHVWEVRHLIRIFNSCLSFIQCFPQDIPSGDMRDVRIMGMRCHFIISAALVSQGRTEDKVEEQLQRYAEMRQHIAAFNTALEGVIQKDPNPNDEQVLNDMLAKASTLYVFDFEGAVCLRSWEGLGQIVRKAKVCKDELMYKAMGDCLLRSHAPGKVLYATMRLIINEIFELEDFDNQQLAKYLRCMFQAVLPLEDTLALQVVDQALQVAREGRLMGNPFPAEELDWVVATTFNHAIDILASGDAALCHQWALKALDLAEYMDDEGDMRDVLREKIVKLGFNKVSR